MITLQSIYHGNIFHAKCYPLPYLECLIENGTIAKVTLGSFIIYHRLSMSLYSNIIKVCH